MESLSNRESTMKTQFVSALQEARLAIQPISDDSLEKCQAHLNTLTKPIGSLGRLESIAARTIAIYAEHMDLPLKKCVYVFAADHGVTDEGVSAYPRTVTAQMLLNFIGGGAAINVLCRMHDVE